MRCHRLFTNFTACFIAVVATPVLAGPIQPYSATALKTAQKAGKAILVDVHADWCPTCRAQAPTIAAISKDPKFAQFVILKLDFDSQEAARAALGVSKQSTLIVYKGAREVSRATGITDPAQIKALVAKAL